MCWHHSSDIFTDLNMKVLAAVILVIGSASALGSGPYLPSGWRPEGPAFELPSPPIVIPAVDVDFQHGSEASSSDFLREYGPPKYQVLPEVATEQAFVSIQEVAGEKSDGNVEAEVATEVTNDLKSEVEEEIVTATEVALPEIIAAQVPVAEERSLNLEVDAEVIEEAVTTQAEELATEKAVVEEAQAELEVNDGVDGIVPLSGELKTELVEEVEKTEEGVKNIAEAIVSLDKDVEQQVQLSQDLTAVKAVELTDSGFAQQVPEGFLEYGPPGFREYGPPNLGARTGNDVTSEEEKIENNETRRRRFSPKFRSAKPKKH